MALIARYPEESNLSVLNVLYERPHKTEDGKYTKDYASIIFRDNDTGVKYQEIIYEPSYRFYKANDGINITYNRFYISKDRVHEIECKYRDLEKTIATLTGNEDFFYENCKSGNRRANRALHTIPTIFSSDTHIEDHIRARFAQDYQNPVITVSKGYFDIEADTYYMEKDFPDMGEVPVNAISFLDDKSNTLNVFLLRDINNPLCEAFENNLRENSSEFMQEVKEFIIQNVGGLEKAKKFKVDNLEFNFAMYDEESQLIIDFFRLVHHLSPDFLIAWNLAFDFPYLYERCRTLGLDPSIVMSASSSEEKFASYFIDMEHKNQYELRGDYYNMAGKTILLDQLVQFASRRKGQAAFPNFKLDTAVNIITKGAVRKLSYSDITNSLAELPRKDYKRFVLYNMVDVVSQKAIEESVKDIDYIYSTCSLNDTRYSKGHRQTVYLTNRVRKFFFERGYILGNNCNTGNEGVSFAGAIVGDPTHNSDYSKVVSNGQVYNVADNCDDFDFKSLYPSIIREHNLAADNIIGKIVITDKVHKYENPYHEEMYDRGGQFMEDLEVNNPLEFGKRWLHLAGIRDLISDVIEYFSRKKMPSKPVVMFTKNGIKPFNVYPNMESKLIKPFHILRKGELVKPFLTSTYYKFHKED